MDAVDPIEQFRTWHREAIASGTLAEPDAVAVASATPDGAPSVRMVLLKGLDERGFVFFTNYRSRKGIELTATKRAALLFYWPGRQVRVEGRVAKVTAAESDAYFASRPLESRLGAWASPQSGVIADRVFLEQRMTELAAKWPDGDVPRPRWWGGFRVRPERIEFWEHRPNRLHDRVRHTRKGRGWVVERLAP